MSKYYEVVFVREYQDREGQTRKQYTRLGTAFPFREKDGFSVTLDAFPAPTEGVYKFLIVPPREKQAQAEQTTADGNSYAKASGGGYGGPLDDEIPFAPEWR